MQSKRNAVKPFKTLRWDGRKKCNCNGYSFISNCKVTLHEKDNPLGMITERNIFLYVHQIFNSGSTLVHECRMYSYSQNFFQGNSMMEEHISVPCRNWY